MIMNVNQRLPVAIQEARARFEIKAPYFCNILWRMVPVEIKSTDDRTYTMGIDKHLRLYYDPQFVDRLSRDDIYKTLLHEVLHFVLAHFDRLTQYEHYETENGITLANIGADLEIHTKHINPPPTNGIVPSMFGLPDGMSAEWYCEELKKKSKKTKIKVGPGQSGDMMEDQFGGGTQTDANGDPIQAPQELGDWEKKVMLQKTAEDINTHKTRGNVGANLEEWASKYLKPQIPWKTVLRRIITDAVATMAGNMDYSHRPERRLRSNVLEPSMIDHKVKCCVLQDSSGSMWYRQGVNTCVTETAEIIHALGTEILWYCADTEVKGGGVIRTTKGVQFRGGGGTSMAHAIHQIQQKHKDLDLLILITDGYTDWPGKLKCSGICVICDNSRADVPRNLFKKVLHINSREE